ncbi:TBC1 domain family member 12-like [Tachyglossus aculeatus]|uniref:TBC1 domain family member 12-like n=1 Tax=Tachyglossus aculeatus TaxID=9261 RepID=UPI0018F344F8|nr:TBC1 domain family member 12-like [Tachyglossus aculeatus]
MTIKALHANHRHSTLERKVRACARRHVGGRAGVPMVGPEDAPPAEPCCCGFRRRLAEEGPAAGRGEEEREQEGEPGSRPAGAASPNPRDPSRGSAAQAPPTPGTGPAAAFGRKFFSKRTKDFKPAIHSAPGWKLFGKIPPRENLQKDSKIIQMEYEARTGRTFKPPLQYTRRKHFEYEPLSTTALILEDRPANLPAKSVEETLRHRQEYEEMVAEAKRREIKDAHERKKKMKEQFKLEENIASAVVIWLNEILPNWEGMRSTRRVRELWWQGLPPSVRGKVWSLAVGNELNITPELYEIFLSRAKERWRNFSEASSENCVEGRLSSCIPYCLLPDLHTMSCFFGTREYPRCYTKYPQIATLCPDGGVSTADREASLELIKLDISRTFPSLYIFQKGGPYHELLHSILGAYTCYRPDVGYVQGMSFVAAVLVLNLEEADAFVVFANLLNKPCQLAFFRVDHSMMLKYFETFEVFFEENLPKLFLHFKAYSLTPDLYLIDWIFTLYSKSLPLDLACRVWDVFCRDGEEFLFRTGLGILGLYEDILLQMDFIHIAQFLTKLPENITSEKLFNCIAAIQMQFSNKKWTQVFATLIKDNKDGERNLSPALKS